MINSHTQHKSPEWIVALHDSRRKDPNETWRRDALLVKALMNGDVLSPGTEIFGDNEYAITANTALTNLDQMARRIVSTQPNVRFISTKPGTDRADERARKRQLATLGFWDKNNMKLLDRQRVRWLLGYGTGPIQIGPHPTLSIPKWNMRDPLSTYAAPTDVQDAFSPEDCIFAFRKSYAWLKQQYPTQAFEVHAEYSHRNLACEADTMFDVLEYVDDHERVTVLVGRSREQATIGRADHDKINCVVELERIEHRLGICPVVAPRLINIDRLKSPYIGNYGTYIMRNKLAALEYIYAERSVFPERYFEEPPNSPNGEIVQVADAKTGVLGHVRGGQLRDMNMAPHFMGTQMIDRLEREERLMNATPAEFGGESASNIRTGQRGQDIMGAAVDFTIQEIQEILELSKEQEVRIAAQVDRKWFDKPKAFYVGWDGHKNDTVDYKPGDIWENAEVHVFYSATGSDANSMVISGGQRVAQGTLSRESFMRMDPFVEDVERERDLIQAEAIDQAGFQALLQPGALDPLAAARLTQLVKSNQMPWYDAFEKVQRERQEAQASNGAPGEPNGPVEPGSPEAQPGLVPGSEEPTIGPNDEQQGLSQLLGALRRPQMTVNGA